MWGGWVIKINCDHSHNHYAPERPVWFIQTLGFPEAITISVLGHGKHKPVIPGLFKSVTETVLKLKHERWADTTLLWEHFRPGRYP